MLSTPAVKFNFAALPCRFRKRSLQVGKSKSLKTSCGKEVKDILRRPNSSFSGDHTNGAELDSVTPLQAWENSL
jgi:hypothetical protein